MWLDGQKYPTNATAGELVVPRRVDQSLLLKILLMRRWYLRMLGWGILGVRFWRYEVDYTRSVCTRRALKHTGFG
jgi:hypothetical protein